MNGEFTVPRRIEIIGGGPAGLYVASLIKRDDPSTHVRIREQNRSGATWGFGVVFSDQALDFLKIGDPEAYELITPRMERWRNMTLVHRGETVTLDGIGFAAIGRLDLIQILQTRAISAGVEIVHETLVTDIDDLEADLIIGADGLNSIVRGDGRLFDAKMDHFTNRFAWFGASRPFQTLTQTFLKTASGAMNAHHYRYASDISTFIVECDESSFFGQGFDAMNETDTAAACEQIFADTLEGASLIANRSIWRQFPKLWCEKWHHENKVLVGDAAHTAHFSIGSGTRLAMEDAIALASALRDHDDITEALAAYEDNRKPVAEKIVAAANTSALWYDSFGEKMALEPVEFAFDYLTRSGRVDSDRLRKLSPEFMKRYDAQKAEGAMAAI
ncbi:MAG: FAD-dependent monooxygenase [Pseudomonadota bacterium]